MDTPPASPPSTRHAAPPRQLPDPAPPVGLIVCASLVAAASAFVGLDTFTGGLLWLYTPWGSDQRALLLLLVAAGTVAVLVRAVVTHRSRIVIAMVAALCCQVSAVTGVTVRFWSDLLW